jgi:hypothetical protein
LFFEPKYLILFKNYYSEIAGPIAKQLVSSISSAGIVYLISSEIELTPTFSNIYFVYFSLGPMCLLTFNIKMR